MFLIGFVLTAWLMARRVRGALLLGIVLTTVIAIVLNSVLAGGKGFATPGAARLPAALVQLPDFSTFGRLDLGVIARLGVVTTILVTFSIMLSDFFDTMGTIIGVGGKGGFLDARGQLPRANRVLLVDSLGAAFGGLANSSSNTTYIESAAGVAEGGRTGLVAGGDRGAVPGRHVVLAAGQRDPGPGHRAGAHHRRLLHDERGPRDRVGRL